MRHERHKLELAPASFQHLSFTDKRTQCEPAGLNFPHLASSQMEFSRWVTKETGASRCRLQQQAVAIPPPPLQLSECDRGAEVLRIKRFRKNYSEAPAKCRFPRPPLPWGPSPLKPEKPERLWQCERWGWERAGTWRSAASHQCRLTDGSIQPTGPQHLIAWSETTRRSHERWWGREANSFSWSSSLQRYVSMCLTQLNLVFSRQGLFYTLKNLTQAYQHWHKWREMPVWKAGSW